MTNGGSAAWLEAGKPCENSACQEVRANYITMKENLDNLITADRVYLTTVVCHDCKKGTELVRDLNGRYCHRAQKHDWLDDCYAAEIHDLLKTTAYQMKEEDAGA